MNKNAKSTYVKIFAIVTLVLFAISFTALLPPPKQAAAATAGTVIYQYDSLGRVINDTNTTGSSGAYRYDPAGNRTSSSIN